MQKKGAFLFAVATATLLVSFGCTKKKEAEKPTAAAKPVASILHIAAPAPATMPKWDASRAVTGPEGLQWIVMEKGSGNKPAVGKTAVVHYAGWLWQGRKFDASVDRHKPFSFVVGKGQVIRGWDLVVADMLPGEYRRVKIPPHIAYGAKGAGAGIIPPNSTLVFDIQLMKVK